MKLKSHVLAILLVMCASAATTYAADDGLITKPSKYR
jgi:hypothetical protein